MTAILVVEDDPVICAVLTDLLVFDLAAVVRCERTGGLGLEAIETAAFDLAIINVNVPEISGYDLARRAANRNIPTLLTSGHPDTDNKLHETECPYLAKPFRLSELLYEAAEAITHATENIRRIKASLDKLQATKKGLQADIAEARRSLDRSKALRAGRNDHSISDAALSIAGTLEEPQRS